MTKQESNSLLITPSLLNSWAYTWLAGDNVREAEADEICIEDKRDLARKKALEEFLKTLNREPIPTNEAMQRGIQYEEDTYKGLTEASPYVEGGAFQIVGKKTEIIQGKEFLLYGRLDCLKGGIIYDIKRVSQYKVQKYLHSYQHGFYMDLFPTAKEFTYLVFDGNKLHQETYYRNQYKPTIAVVNEFINWLRSHDLLELYLEKWKARKEK